MKNFRKYIQRHWRWWLKVIYCTCTLVPGVIIFNPTFGIQSIWGKHEPTIREVSVTEKKTIPTTHPLPQTVIHHHFIFKSTRASLLMNFLLGMSFHD